MVAQAPACQRQIQWLLQPERIQICISGESYSSPDVRERHGEGSVSSLQILSFFKNQVFCPRGKAKFFTALIRARGTRHTSASNLAPRENILNYSALQHYFTASI